MDSKQLSDLVIRPTLELLDEFNPKLNTLASVNLLLGTVAQESSMGHYLKQIHGPALGIYQIEPATHKDITGRYLVRPANLALMVAIKRLTCVDGFVGRDTELIYNLRYATAICRIRYWMVPESMPEHDDIEGLGQYWDDHYNGNPDVGTVDEFISNYTKYVKH